ncbi:MAG: hypothetical protein ACI84C_002195 [Flavobacteriales bacterium]
MYDTDGNLIDYNDDQCGWQSKIVWTADFDGVVLILINEYYCDSNNDCRTISVTWNSSATGPETSVSPTNDACSDAIAIDCGDAIPGYTSLADFDYAETFD